jgi:hypothetical protein
MRFLAPEDGTRRRHRFDAPDDQATTLLFVASDAKMLAEIVRGHACDRISHVRVVHHVTVRPREVRSWRNGTP